jgi:hypothetical protein
MQALVTIVHEGNGYVSAHVSLAMLLTFSDLI